MLPLRHQLLVVGCLLVVVGGMLSTGGQWTIGGTIGLWGVVMSVAGFFLPDGHRIDAEAVAAWRPSAETLMDAGRTMYRVDTTIDPPIVSTILCGACAHIAEVDGGRPATWTCPGCGLDLWRSEEE